MIKFSSEKMRQEMEHFCIDFQRLETEIAKRFVGQKQLIRDTLTAMIARGHILLEGAPGLGKTFLLKTIAETVDGRFSRIQFTPDLIPADLTGTEIIIAKGDLSQIEYRKGPIFTNFLLADEINRAAPKTQSALLEGMEENTVTAGGICHPLPSFFFVMATQNPIEMEGTYPLPESQLDRFFAKLILPFPTLSELSQILRKTVESDLPKLEKVISIDRIIEMGEFARTVPAASSLTDKITRLISATHPDSPLAPDVVKRFVRYGAGPRGARSLFLGAKIAALLDRRFNVAEEDIRAAAPMTLRHRLILNFEGYAEKISPDEIITHLLKS